MYCSIRIGRQVPWLVGLIIAFGPCFAGCGGSKDGDVVIPKVSPADQSKDSMNYYRDNHLKKGKKK
jgi:hypothetical protein